MPDRLVTVQRQTLVVTERDLLVRAADLLEEFGWRQMHVGSKRQGAFCALGAINEAARDLGVPRAEKWRHARARLASHTGGSVAHWNDARGQTRERVVATLRSLAGQPASTHPASAADTRKDG